MVKCAHAWLDHEIYDLFQGFFWSEMTLNYNVAFEWEAPWSSGHRSGLQSESSAVRNSAKPNFFVKKFNCLVPKKMAYVYVV